jgi:sterol 3beta-glucosyltransferase
LYAYSDQIVPKPADWGENVHVTGYWECQPDTTWQPPTALLDFLNAGPVPVYIGFGSMFGTNSERRGQIILDALKQSSQRAILATGWGGLKVDANASEVFVIEQAPHEWLFNCVSAVVHHGGAGTTAAGLRAGKPTLICPFMGDQGFWGRRVEALGVGAAPIPQKALTAEKLAAALTQITTDSAMRERAEALGTRLRSENGAVRAAEILEREIQ